MDFDLDGGQALVALGLWVICSIFVWKSFIDYWQTWQKIVLTIIMLPICYIIVNRVSES